MPTVHSHSVFLNGTWVLLADARLSIFDVGLVQGVTVTERIRTFRLVPFRLPQHLLRLRSSLAAIGLHLPESDSELTEIVSQLIAQPSHSLGPGQDLGIVIFVTPGLAADRSEQRATLCVHGVPLNSSQWKNAYEQGQALIIPSSRQSVVPGIDPRIKHRSRLHWYLAEQQVKQQNPHAAALLLDEDGFLTETNTGNLFVLQHGRLRTPRPEKTLNGISQEFVQELAAELGLRTETADLTPDDLLRADEAFLTSTSYCLLPVTSLNGQKIATGRPGAWSTRLLDLWSTTVGVDILQQG